MSGYEVEALLNGHFENYKNTWEQVRMICYITAQCQSTKPIKPQDILSFAWDVESNAVHVENIEDLKKNMANVFANDKHKIVSSVADLR